MKILALSDKVVPFIYSNQIRSRFSEIDLVLGCGDLPYYYLEFVLDSLDLPLFFVRGNHDVLVEHSSEAQRTKPNGATDLHVRHARYGSLLLAGVEGSRKYREGPFQYTQSGMWWHVFRLVPGLFRNRLIHGYATISDEVVWGVLETNLPVITREVGDLLEKAGDSS